MWIYFVFVGMPLALISVLQIAAWLQKDVFFFFSARTDVHTGAAEK